MSHRLCNVDGQCECVCVHEHVLACVCVCVSVHTCAQVKLEVNPRASSSGSAHQEMQGSSQGDIKPSLALSRMLFQPLLKSVAF